MCPMEGKNLSLENNKYLPIFQFFITEIVRAMNYCITQGWAMYWGTAKWSPPEVN